MVEVASPAPRTTPEADDIRAAELAFLKERFSAEHGSVVVIHGRRGVGKARLSEELVKHASHQPKTAVLEGRTPQAAGGSFHPFAEIAHQAMAWAETAGATEAVIDPVYRDLAAVLDRAEAEPDSPPVLVDQKLKFFDAFRRLLAAIAERARLLIVVHDLERADSDTLELASYLSDELFGDPALDARNGRPGLLVFLMRDDGSESEGTRDFLAEALESRSISAIRLEGLDLEGLRRYVQSPRVLEKLLSASKGLPQEIDALIDSLPTNVEELFERRLSTLDSIARGTLYALAISGRPASARALSEVTGQAVKSVAQALSELRDQRVLERRIHRGEFQFAFARRSDLEVALRVVPADDRSRLHGGWAAVLAKEPEGGHLALLAHHQLRSNAPIRGVTTAVQAAEAHAVAGAFDAAVQMLEDALPFATGELCLSILARLAELTQLNGSPKRALRYVEAWKAALPEAQKGKAFHREAELYNAAGDYDQALVAIEEARRATPPAALSERAAIEATASESYYHLGQLDKAMESGEAGLRWLGELSGEVPSRTELELLNLLGKAALAGDQPERAVRIFQNTLVLAEKSGLQREQARALVNLGYAHFRAGSTRDAESHLCSGIEHAQEANDISHLAFGHMNLGVVLHQKGELGRAIECYRECKSLFRRIGNKTQLARVLHNLANLYLLCGDVPRARAHNDEALRLARSSGVERLVAIATALDGLLISESGDKAGAEARLREAMVHQRRLGMQRPLESMVELAELELRFGDVERAEVTMAEVEEALATVDNRLLSVRAELVRGRIMVELGDAAALKVLEAAKSQIETLGRMLLLRDAELAIGKAQERLGQRETARMHYAAALEIQRDVGEELPEDLRRQFMAARPQKEVELAIKALEGASEKPERVRASMKHEPLPEIERFEPSPSAAALAARRELVRRPEWASKYAAIIGNSPKLHRVFHIIDRVAPSDGTVLILGESGTGKELVAEAIHRSSPRAKGPFVKLNCAALVESLLLSELFGHERGSFTGAHQRKIGRFEMAAGGTIFLDEIGDISPKTQVALLRVLQEREFERVGGGRPIKVEARIIVATNRNLFEMVREGTFREDLYYRLKGLTVDLPPLRERSEDIILLAEHFLAQYAAESGSLEKRLSKSAIETLLAYSWPGNIRELENIVRSVALFAESPTIEVRDFDEYRELFLQGPAWAPISPAAPAPSAPVAAVSAPAMPSSPPPPPIEDEDADQEDEPSTLIPFRRGEEMSEAASPDLDSELLSRIFAQGVPLPELKKRIQEQAIARALRMTKGNITRAAEVLGMRRPRLSQIINASEELKGLCQGVDR
jgi:transcriptional regulator with GAF, ATPase, and Fis domain